MGAESNSSTGLKRLDFVRSYSEFAFNKTYDIASTVYTTGKGYVPASVQPHLKAAEEKVAEVGSPLVAKFQDQSEQVLSTLDSKVNSLILSAHKQYQSAAKELNTHVEKQKHFHEKNLEHYKKAREAYLKKIEETVDFLKKEGLSGTAKLAADSVKARVEDAKQLPAYFDKEAKVLMSRVTEAWHKLASYPAVQKILEAAQPSIDFAWKKYSVAHDAVAGSSYYHTAYKTGTDVVSKVQDTDLYKSANSRLYPVIAPYADPALDKITASPYYKAAVDHLKPIKA